MLTAKDVIGHCLALEGAVITYPFGPEVLVMKNAKQKMFCLIHEESDPLHIILKCDPEDAIVLRENYPCIKPGYHCNKKHWNSVYIDETLEDDMVRGMITAAYDLVTPKPRVKK